jgi:hypothetical protein
VAPLQALWLGFHDGSIDPSAGDRIWDHIADLKACYGLQTFIDGVADGDMFGYAVQLVQDATGDLVPDLAVGAPFHDAGGSDLGSVYVYDEALLDCQVLGPGNGAEMGRAFQLPLAGGFRDDSDGILSDPARPLVFYELAGPCGGADPGNVLRAWKSLASPPAVVLDMR